MVRIIIILNLIMVVVVVNHPRPIYILLLAMVISLANGVQAAQNKDETVIKTFDWGKTSQLPDLLKNGTLPASQIPNPHWRDDACMACHSQDGTQATAQNVRSVQNGTVCLNCHDARFDHSYIHPVDIKPEAAMSNIKEPFKQSLAMTNGKITCVTCHDLTIQCLADKKKEQGFNPRFFRGGPFKTRSEQCFHCHDEDRYQRLNPHDQIDEQGKLKENTCLICHSGSIESIKQANSIDDVKFNITNNLEKMCLGCHNWTPHPGGQFTFFSNGKGPDHLVKPSAYVQDTLEKMSKKYDIEFPLEPGTGRVFCGTCHNSHEAGVVRNKKSEKGADSFKRLREKDICHYCHAK